MCQALLLFLEVIMSIDREQYAFEIESACGAAFLRVNRNLKYLFDFQPILILLMSILMERFVLEKKEKRLLVRRDGVWFFYPSKYFYNEFRIKRKAEQRWFRKLKEMGFVETKMSGNPAKRIVHITPYFLAQIKSISDGPIKEPPTKWTRPPEDRAPAGSSIGPALNRNNRLNNKYSHSAGVRGSVKGFSKQKKEHKHAIHWYNKAAHILFEGLKERNMVGKVPNLNNWAQDFRKLHELDQVPKKQIRAVLNWYCHNIRGEYVPVVQSGKSFRDKYDKLLAALERRKDQKPDDTYGKGDPTSHMIIRDTVTRVWDPSEEWDPTEE